VIGREAVLVTGGAGFVGRHTVDACRRAGFQVTAVDLRAAPAHLVDAAEWRRGDFADSKLLAEVAAGRYTAVLHQAGISDTRAKQDAALAETNTLGPLRLGQAAREAGARFLYASSHSVYGTLYRREPITEDADEDRDRCSGPLNPYARSKLELDRLMRARYGRGPDWAGLRYTNVFGADEQDKGAMASILSQLVRQAATAGRVRVFADTLTAARDYVPVETVADTLVLLVRRPVPAGVYNLGAGFAVSFAELLQWCAEFLRDAGRPVLEVEMTANPVRAAYQYFTCADMRATDQVLAERPIVTLGEIRARALALFGVFRRETDLVAP
jgi:nucleoside-diphosphate-sugar epimerase